MIYSFYHIGDRQRQDGRYVYKYKDLNGDTKFVCSWRLDKNNRASVGKARDFSLREKEQQIRQEPMIDGYTGFLFLNKNEMPMVALHWEKYLEHIWKKYNSIYIIQLPKITPHVCRHTFCSNMAKSGMNPKTL